MIVGSNKYRIRFTSLAILFCVGSLVIGWQSNNFYRYMSDIFRKAAACERMIGGCEDVSYMASQEIIKKTKLPTN